MINQEDRIEIEQIIEDRIKKVTGQMDVLNSAIKNRHLDLTGGVDVDTVNEKTSGTGVTLDGVLLKDSEVTTDTINEKTAAAGVTIDSLQIKDQKLITPLDIGTLYGTYNWSSSINTTSGTIVDMTDVTLSITAPTGGGIVIAWMGSSYANSTVTDQAFIGINIEGTDATFLQRFSPPRTDKYYPATTFAIKAVSAGSVVVKGRWYVEGGATLKTDKGQLVAVFIPYAA